MSKIRRRQTTPLFLSKHVVLDIHDQQLQEHGGEVGMRDEGALESSLAQPKVQFGGKYLHENLFEMAAAYLFHLANNHAFVDGNKRTALAAALVFLEINGYRVADEGTALADMVLEMIEHKRDKSWVAGQLRRRSQPSPDNTFTDEEPK